MVYNNWVDKPGWIYTNVAYLDNEEYMADRIFKNNNLHVKFKNGEFGKANGNWVIVFGKIHTKDRHKFDYCMTELKNSIMIMGKDAYDSYINTCKEINDLLNVR